MVIRNHAIGFRRARSLSAILIDERVPYRHMEFIDVETRGKNGTVEFLSMRGFFKTMLILFASDPATKLYVQS